MTEPWDGQALLAPLSDAQPCGIDLDETGIFVALDGLRLFGLDWSPDNPPQSPDQGIEGARTKAPPDWNQIRAASLEGLGRSKDLRLLVYLGASVLRTDGLGPFVQVLTAAAAWLDEFWPSVYPLIDEDAIARLNALNGFADLMAIVDRVRRLPLVESRKHGRFSLRDLEIASGQLTPAASEARPDEAAIQSAFREMPAAEWERLDRLAADGTRALHAIDARMRSEAGSDFVPDFGPLLTQFAKLTRLTREQLAAHAPGGGAPEAMAAGAAGEAGQPAPIAGAIRSRQDAIRALEAVSEFFRGSEPSSPIPLLVDRARRLVSKDFLEVLADIAPDAVATARSAGGLKDYPDNQ